jgi:hypothetical protein
MSTKTKGVPIPDVPDFRDYGHGFPARPSELNKDMIYASDMGDVLRITGIVKSAVVCEILLFNDDAILEWIEVNYMIPVRRLHAYTEDMRRYTVDRQQASVVRAANLKKQRRETAARNRRDEAEKNFFEALGLKIHPHLPVNPRQKGNASMSLFMSQTEYKKLKVILRAAQSEGLA